MTFKQMIKGLIMITWRISSWAEISAWLLKQILLKSNCPLHGEDSVWGVIQLRQKILSRCFKGLITWRISARLTGLRSQPSF